MEEQLFKECPKDAKEVIELIFDSRFHARWFIESNGANCEIREITGLNDKIPVFGEDFDPDWKAAEIYLHCWIKWDGCSHFYFNEYIHMCGVLSFKMHSHLMRYLWERAFALMEREEDAPWDI